MVEDRRTNIAGKWRIRCGEFEEAFYVNLMAFITFAYSIQPFLSIVNCPIKPIPPDCQMPVFENIPEGDHSITRKDEWLLQQMAEGNREAFTELYERYWEDLFVTSAKALRGEREAADVVQDVFLSLWQRRKELSIQGSLAAYLHMSVRYKCTHYIEKNITRRDYLVQLAEAAAGAVSPNAEINLQVKEIQEAINRAVAGMPPKMQQVYRLSRHEHLSFSEIADRLCISVETVRKHIQHALQVIRKNIEPYSFLLISSLLFYPA
jgi:RNA polymerase sigma-70 factor (ECF subfamily)